MGPTVLFDKSALQALSMDESVWFDTFFGVNVVPIFYVETLADKVLVDRSTTSKRVVTVWRAKRLISACRRWRLARTLAL